VDFVQNALRSLKANKDVGLDKLGARLLKDASDVIALVLTELINKSFADGEFPKVWKSAKVSALFKVEDKSQKDNSPTDINLTYHRQYYREISACSALYLPRTERTVITIRVWFPPKALNIYRPSRIYRSNPREHGHGCVTGAVFLDLRKAFDTVDHLILVNKLKTLEVVGKSLAWFRSYLSDRSQQTICNNAISPPAKITIGVPQGSILGPLLVYINGIQSVLQHSKMTIFADDMRFIAMRAAQMTCNQN